MPNIKPVSDLRNYTEVLNDIRPGSPVFLTKNGRGRYVVVDMQEYEKNQAALKLMSELEKGRVSGEKEGWSTIEEAQKNSVSFENQPLLSAEALRDLKSIQSYIANGQESPQNALKVVESIIARIEGLLHFPNTGTLLAPKVDFETNYRYAKASGYLIFYRHENGRIFVDRIIHGRRNYITILDPTTDKDY